MPDSANLRPAPPEFHTRLKRLIDAHFPHLQKARIRVQVRDTALVSRHSRAWGEVDTPDNDAERAEFDFSIWFALDMWQQLDEYQRDALTFHELSHCGWDDSGAPLLIYHDLEVFYAELALFGPWWGTDAPQFVNAISKMPPLHEGPDLSAIDSGLERVGDDMPLGYGGFQKPMRGNHGSTGAGNHGSTGAGNHGSTGAGNHGSTGAKVAWSDPGIAQGGDFFTVELGNGEVLELCPDCFRAAAESILNDLLTMSWGAAPQQGNHGSTGA